MRRFLENTSGAFSIVFLAACIPLLALIAYAIDVSNMLRQRQDIQTALDAASIATAKVALTVDRERLEEYAKQMFEVNVHSLPLSKVNLVTELAPVDEPGSLRLTASFDYEPLLMGAVYELVGGSSTSPMSFRSVIKLSGKVEVAMVIDNSFSMIFDGNGTSRERIFTVRKASRAAVESMATSADTRVALIPFASTVNVGKNNKNAAWIDQTGIAPIHHENFAWSYSFPGNPATCAKCAEKIGNIWFARGAGWGAERNKPLTRFTLFDAVGEEWGGCVEARPGSYNLSKFPASASQDASGMITGDPNSMFVPMFAVDEAGSSRDLNNWWTNSSGGTDKDQQSNVERYFTGSAVTHAAKFGPNFDCTAQPIIPLSDISQETSKKRMLDTIAAMQPNGDTNVGDAIAWGYRALTPGLPFDETQSYTTGVQRYMIVLTDGANIYNVSANNAGTVSRYGVHGYVRPWDRTNENRIFQGTGVTPGTSEQSFNDALDANMKRICDVVKNERIILITLALDLNQSNSEDAQQIQLLQDCASPDARSRSGPASTASLQRDAGERPDPEKLFWNISSDKLEEVLSSIVSNMQDMYIAK